MKKIVIVLALAACQLTSFAQTTCTNFDNEATTGLVGQVGTNAAVGATFGNWMQRCGLMAIRSDANSLAPGNNYLYLQDVGCGNGSSLVWNSIDFSGNWTQFNNCFCYDFNVINNGNAAPPPPSILTIYSGNTPIGATLSAKFVLNSPMIAGSGWRTICPPISLSDGAGNLPSNALGGWVMNNSGTSADWDALITNVGGIMFNLDIGGSPTEQYGVDNICFQQCPPNQQPNPQIPKVTNCHCTPLDIWNYWGTPDPLPVQNATVNGVNLSYAEETFELHRNSAIPITELRVDITDIDFEYEYEQCAQCVNNPALWGSIYSSDNAIGTAPNSLNQNPPFTLTNWANNTTSGVNVREIKWQNPNGAMLLSGDKFKVSYVLPPISEIPCCATKVKICVKVSWKDANCCQSVVYTCSNIDLSNKIKSLGIINKANGCCERTLVAETDKPATYLWNTGATSQQINVSENGIYTVTATAGGASITQTIVVSDILKGNFPTLSYWHTATPDLGNNFIIRDYTKADGAPMSYNATKYTLWIFSRWDTDPYNGAFRKITGTASCGDGLKNGVIQWDGRDDQGNKVQSGMYNFVLRLENCDHPCSDNVNLCNECHNYERYHYGSTSGCNNPKNCQYDCIDCVKKWKFPIPWPIWVCEDGWGISQNRVGVINLQW
ncbi:MAG: hypothetical protein H6607_01070 [Flavobacteriales bacterium]|nr:hypothetical protein [Flavobacteriales bacterium]